jgi:hypothetical protein
MEKREKEPIPQEFSTLKQTADFWDTHSAADYWGDMEDVELEVNIQDRRSAVLLEDAVYHAVEELAATRGIRLDMFVNEFLRRELVHG